MTENTKTPRELMQELFPNSVEAYEWNKDHCPNFKSHSKGTEDEVPSFNWKVHSDGHIQLKCFAGCTTKQICKAAGINPGQLYPDDYRHPKIDYDHPEKRFYYYLTSNQLLYEVWLWKFGIDDEKLKRKVQHFVHEDLNKKGRYVHKNDTGIEFILYNYPALFASPKEETIYFVEGEKDADNCEKIGLLATTTPFGAGNSHHTKDLAICSGRNIVFFIDNDKPGQKYATSLALRLAETAKSIKIINLNRPDTPLKRGGDITDWTIRHGYKFGDGENEDIRKQLESIVAETTESDLRGLKAIASRLGIHLDALELANSPDKNADLFLEEQFLYLESDEEFYLIKYWQGQFWNYDFKYPAQWKFLDKELLDVWIQTFYKRGKVRVRGKNITMDNVMLPGVDGTVLDDFNIRNKDIDELRGALRRNEMLWQDFEDEVSAIHWLVEENPNEPRPAVDKIIPLKDSLLDITDFDNFDTFEKTPFLWHTFCLEVDKTRILTNPMMVERKIIPWDEIVSQILDGQEEMILQYGKIIAAICFRTGLIRDRIFLILGSGGSAKTTLVQPLRYIFPPKAILDTNVYSLSEDQFALACLPEARIISLDNCKWMSGSNYHRFLGIVERISSGITEQIRKSTKNPFGFRSTAKIIITAASPPPYAETGRQFRRRIVGVHCPLHFEVDDTFTERHIEPQRDFIFYEWAPHYFKLFNKEGFKSIPIIDQMMDDAKPNAESLGDWIRATYKRVKKAKTSVDSAWHKWKVHCDLLEKTNVKEMTGLKSYNQKAEFSKEVTLECGYEKKSAKIDGSVKKAFIDMEIIPERSDGTPLTRE